MSLASRRRKNRADLRGTADHKAPHRTGGLRVNLAQSTSLASLLAQSLPRSSSPSAGSLLCTQIRLNKLTSSGLLM